jgi:hypothetical protein
VYDSLALTRFHRAFIVAILAMLSIGLQNYLFSSSASSLSRKLRSLSLRAVLRQDSKSSFRMPLCTVLIIVSRVL